MRGITPIVSIVILLLITVAIGGAGYTFISGFYQGVLGSPIEITGSFCSNGVGNVIIRNIGQNTIQLPTQLQQTESYKPDGNTVLLLHFDEGSGNIAKDSSANGNNGVFGDGLCIPGIGTCPSWDSGLMGGAVRFDGLDDFINMTRFDVPGGEITIEAWINISSTNPSYGRVLSKATGTPSSQHYFMLSTDKSSGSYVPRGRITTTGTGGGTSTVSGVSAFPIQTEKWTHVAAVWNNVTQGGRLFIYKDGVMVKSGSRQGISLKTNPDIDVWAGANPPTGDDPFKGEIDELRVLNKSINFSQPQQGWFYACNATKCGDLFVEKTQGSQTPIYFDQTELLPGRAAILKNSCSGSCYYTIVSGGSSQKAGVTC